MGYHRYHMFVKGEAYMEELDIVTTLEPNEFIYCAKEELEPVWGKDKVKFHAIPFVGQYVSIDLGRGVIVAVVQSYQLPAFRRYFNIRGGYAHVCSWNESFV